MSDKPNDPLKLTAGKRERKRAWPVVAARVTPTDYLLLSAAAEDEGVSRGEFIRSVLGKAVRERLAATAVAPERRTGAERRGNGEEAA